MELAKLVRSSRCRRASFAALHPPTPRPTSPVVRIVWVTIVWELGCIGAIRPVGIGSNVTNIPIRT
jgi:hypothetical protein